MMRHLFLLLCLGCTFWVQTTPASAQSRPAAKSATGSPAALAGGAQLVEKVLPKPGELVIAYEKYVLPNGLTLLVHEDHSDPLVTVDVNYHVGSAREQVGKSGFAHFFEHMMFQGSDHVGDEQHFKIVTAAGGNLNGSTSRDLTSYYETVPRNQLETVLWLEADRMGFLLDAVTRKKFENQRATVKNERAQNYDNRPYGLAPEYTAQTLYPYSHPYSRLPIGSPADLDRADLTDLKNFFLRWYGPNNATVAVGGDVRPADVLRLVAKYFGSISRGPAVQEQKLPLPQLSQNRYVSYQDNVRAPMLQLVFPTVPRGHADEIALDALADLLGNGKTSLLYKNLVKPQRAVKAQATHPTSELAGEFTLTVTARPGQRLDSLEQLVRHTLTELERPGIQEEELQQFKNRYEAQLVDRIGSVDGKVKLLASNETLLGNPNFLTVELRRLRALSVADVQRVYSQYLRQKPAVVLSIVPKNAAHLVAQADNYQAGPTDYKAPADEYAGLKYVKATDSFDRKKIPTPGPAPVIQAPVLWRTQFPNGLRVMGSTNLETPAVTLLLTIRGGHRMEQFDRELAGVATLAANMLHEGTEQYSGEEFAAALARYGIVMQTVVTAENTTITVRTLRRNLRPALGLLEEMMMNPRFDKNDFVRMKRQTVESIANQNEQPTTIANNTFARLIYGPTDVMSIPVHGSKASVETLTLDEVKRFYDRYYTPTLASLVVVGAIEQDSIVRRLDFLKDWRGKKINMPADDPAPGPDKTRIYFVHKAGAAQSEIRIGLPALTYDAVGVYYQAYLANYLLGGAFNSRINLNLREDKGYTYSASSRFQGSRYRGHFVAQAGVRADVTAASVREIMKEISTYSQEGITDDELQFLKNSVGQADALRYETGQQKAAFLARLLEYDLAPDYMLQQSMVLHNLTKEDILTVARQYLPADHMYIVVVGDRAKVFPSITELDYEVIELDAEGERVGSTSALPAPREPMTAASSEDDDEVVERKNKRKARDAEGRKVKVKVKEADLDDE